MSRSWSKWVPAVTAVVVVAGVAIAMPAAANASVSLPDKTPTQLLELVASSNVRAFSGTVEETSDLDLPTLPSGSAASASGGSSAGALGAADLALLTGPNSLRVYVDGPTKARVQNLESLAERDVIRNGTDVWVYNSKDNSAAHATGVASRSATPDATDASPTVLARKLIAELEPSSRLSIDSNVRVAGRPAYQLVLTPRASDTLVGSISIAV